jgi:glucose/arabinose dehydrogenase
VRRSVVAIALLLAALAALAALVAPVRAAAPSGEVVARGIPFATNVAFDRRGGMWVTSGAPFHEPGDGVWYVAGPGARPVHVIRGTLTALGLAWLRGRLYLASLLGPRTGIVSRYSGFDGRAFAHRRVVVPAISVGLHTLGTIAPGPGRRLYLGVGAEQDAQAGGHVTSGTVVSFRADGSALRIEARGLRGPFGLAFVPGTASLLVTDDGRDDLGPARPPDELDLVRDVTRAAPDFGFPGCEDAGGPVCARTVAPLAPLPAHAGVGGVAVAAHWGRGGLTALVAENGSLVPGVDAGRDVRAVALRRRPGGGYLATTTVLAAGYQAQDPLGTAIGPDGALYLTLLRSGEVVRLAPGG